MLDEQPKKLYDSVANGNLTQAQSIFYKQLPMLRFIVSGNISRAIKAGLKLRRVEAGLPRKPLRGPEVDEQMQLEALMA